MDTATIRRLAYDPVGWRTIRIATHADTLVAALEPGDDPVLLARLAWVMGARQERLAEATLAAIRMDRAAYLPMEERAQRYRELAHSCKRRLLTEAGNLLQMESQAVLNFICGQAQVEIGHPYEGLGLLSAAETLYWALGLDTAAIQQKIHHVQASPALRVEGHRASLRAALTGGNPGLICSVADDLADAAAQTLNYAALREAIIHMRPGPACEAYRQSLAYLMGNRHTPGPEHPQEARATLPQVIAVQRRLENEVMVPAWKMQHAESLNAAEKLLGCTMTETRDQDQGADLWRLIRAITAIYARRPNIAHEVLAQGIGTLKLQFYALAVRMELAIFEGLRPDVDMASLHAVLESVQGGTRAWIIQVAVRLTPNALLFASRELGGDFQLRVGNRVWVIPPQTQALANSHRLDASGAKKLQAVRDYIDGHPDQSVATMLH